jgi:hypothetical protein
MPEEKKLAQWLDASTLIEARGKRNAVGVKQFRLGFIEMPGDGCGYAMVLRFAYAMAVLC